MAERRIICMISLVMLVVSAASLPSTALPAAAPTADGPKLQAAPSDPNQPAPAIPEPNKPDPNQITPLVPELNQIDANSLEAGKSAPVGTDANDVVRPAIEPNDIDANNVSPRAAEPNDPNSRSPAAFHNKCAFILKTFVNANGMVDYKSLTRKKPNLSALLDEFNKFNPNVYESWPKEDKIAFWINAYNIKMLDIIVNNYPIEPLSRFHSAIWGAKSVRHIDGIQTKFKFLVMDEAFTLLEIDKRFFHGTFDEPRVLFALTRASLSSPPLRNEPYSGDKLNQQLDDQAKKFFSNPLAFKIDKSKEKVYLSALFQKNEYGRMFLAKYGIDRKFKANEPETRAVLNFITNFVSEDVKSYLELGNYTVQFMGYDWTINEGS